MYSNSINHKPIPSHIPAHLSKQGGSHADGIKNILSNYLNARRLCTQYGVPMSSKKYFVNQLAEIIAQHPLCLNQVLVESVAPIVGDRIAVRNILDEARLQYRMNDLKRFTISTKTASISGSANNAHSQVRPYAHSQVRPYAHSHLHPNYESVQYDCDDMSIISTIDAVSQLDRADTHHVGHRTYVSGNNVSGNNASGTPNDSCDNIGNFSDTEYIADIVATDGAFADTLDLYEPNKKNYADAYYIDSPTISWKHHLRTPHNDTLRRYYSDDEFDSEDADYVSDGSCDSEFDDDDDHPDGINDFRRACREDGYFSSTPRRVVGYNNDDYDDYNDYNIDNNNGIDNSNINSNINSADDYTYIEYDDYEPYINVTHTPEQIQKALSKI